MIRLRGLTARGLLAGLVRASALAAALLPAAARAQAAAPPPAAGRSLSPADQRALVQSIGALVEARYVLPDVGKAMSAHLRRRLEQGAYARPTAPADFAERVQIDLREVGKDRHLFVIHDPRLVKELRAASASGGDDTPSGTELEESRRQNFGVREVRILDGNVGYLDLRDFEHPSLSGPKLVGAMALLSDCDAIVIDLRSNGGGWPGTTAMLASYFFAAGKAVHFTDLHDRVKGDTSQSWTLPFVPGKTLPSTPLFIVTSQRTFSAAEELAYDMQALKRATIVGERTRGGANLVESVVVDDEFVLSVPQGRPTSPVTGANWEGSGVVPDVPAPEKQALDTAHRRALEQLLAASTRDEDRFRFQWALDGLSARVRPVAVEARALQECAGTYGTRRVTFEDGTLFDQRVDRPRQALVPLGPGYFAIDGLERERLRFVREQGRVTGVVVLSRSGASRTLPRAAP